MKLNSPFVITSRLLPGLQFRTPAGLIEVSLTVDGHEPDGRTRFRYYIDGPGVEYSAADLRSGCGNGGGVKGLQDAFGTLLSFMGAFLESRRYTNAFGEHGENADLFPESLESVLSNIEDQLTCAQLEIEESKKPLIEE